MQGPLDRIPGILPDRVRRVVERETPIPTVAARAAEMKRTHPELVRADIGQIVGLDGVEDVLYGPPPGLPELRAALAETWNLAMGLGDAEGPGSIAAANVAICSGAAEGLSILLRCFASGKTVGLPRGHWENYANGVDLAGGEIVLVDYFDAEGRLDVAGIGEAIARHGIGVLVTNFPTNPTGSVLEDAEYAALAAVVAERDVVVIADEVYNRLRFDGHAPRTLVRFAPAHAVAVSSASKEYLLPGARVGYVVSARPIVTDLVMKKMIRANTASPNVLGQRKLLEYLEPDLEDLRAGRTPRFIARVREEMRRRRDGLLAVLERHGIRTVGRSGRAPAGTIFLMAGLPEWWSGDDVGFVEAALSRGLFSSVPGSAFGLPGSVRLSYGAMTPPEIARFDAALETMRREAGAGR
ncbi:MAG: pyridoxal phosphate-dependent aminotransferase [Planctomycetota bacterium]